MLFRIIFIGIATTIALYFANQLIAHFTKSDSEKLAKNDVPIEVGEKKVIKIAMNSGGKITLPEICMKSNLSVDKAKEALDSLLNKNIMTIQMTESGTTLYSIIDMASEQEKNDAIDLV